MKGDTELQYSIAPISNGNSFEGISSGALNSRAEWATRGSWTRCANSQHDHEFDRIRGAPVQVYNSPGLFLIGTDIKNVLEPRIYLAT